VNYAFRPFAAYDLSVVRGWIGTPDVSGWWEDDGDLEEGLASPAIRQWIVSLDERPFAYLQDYDPHAWPDHPFAFPPPGSRGIDQFIGVPELIGAGHGSAFIRHHVEQLFAGGVPAVGTDPHPDNTRAVRAYEKAGFTPGRTQDTEWGLCLLMTRYKDAA
jgi:aminoglycoside 6'-N-acetyltransferase